MEDYGTNIVLIITAVGTVVVLGLVVFLRNRQDKQDKTK
jgi:hypothetical protein